MKTKVTADAIIELLKAKHFKDVFVPECKTGPSQTAAHLRIDAWAMIKSWANPRVLAYEVKISRADFLADNKWHAYTAYCNEFYFVCPKGIVNGTDLPDGIGLLWVAGTGNRLLTQRKAAYREITVPEDLYRYILMCRSIISRDTFNDADKAEEWKAWLASRDEDRKLGWRVSRKIREHCDQVQAENERLKKRMIEYDRIKSDMTRLGLNPETVNTWDIERKAKEMKQIVPDSFIWGVKRLKESCEDLEKHLQANKLTSE